MVFGRACTMIGTISTLYFLASSVTGAAGFRCGSSQRDVRTIRPMPHTAAGNPITVTAQKLPGVNGTPLLDVVAGSLPSDVR